MRILNLFFIFILSSSYAWTFPWSPKSDSDSCAVPVVQDVYSLEHQNSNPTSQANDPSVWNGLSLKVIPLTQEFIDLVNEVNADLLKTFMGSYLLQNAYKCSQELARTALGFIDFNPGFLGIKQEVQTSLSQSLALCRRDRSSGPLFSGGHNRNIIRVDMPNVNMHSWTDKSGVTMVNLRNEELNREILGGRLFHELYIQHDAGFFEMNTFTARDFFFRQILRVNPDYGTEGNMKILADPVLQASLASLRAFKMEDLERPALEKIFGLDAAVEKAWIEQWNTEQGCLDLLTDVFEELVGGACGIHSAKSAEVTFRITYGRGARPAGPSRKEIIHNAKEALILLKKISAEGMRKSVGGSNSETKIELCKTLTLPVLQTSGISTSIGPSARISPSRRSGRKK